MNAYRNASYVGFVLFLIGLVLVGYGIVNFKKEVKTDNIGLKATGKVFDFNVTVPYSQAWVEFKTEKGKSVRFLDKLMWNTHFQKYKIGQQVEVVYEPADPEKTARINEFFQRNIEPWFPVIIGGVLFLVGFVLRRIMLRKAKQFDEERARG